MTKALDQERKAARLIAQHQRNRFAGANRRLEQATRRIQKLSGAAQRRDA